MWWVGRFAVDTEPRGAAGTDKCADVQVGCEAGREAIQLGTRRDALLHVDDVAAGDEVGHVAGLDRGGGREQREQTFLHFSVLACHVRGTMRR